LVHRGVEGWCIEAGKGRKRVGKGVSGAAIDIRHLGKRYESDHSSVLALDDINLRVAAGEFLCIVGPSGCGKSTLLRILADLETRTCGEIAVEGGSQVTNAMIFQQSGLFPWMTVEENVAFGLETRGVGRRERLERAGRALEMVGLSRFRRHYPHQVSGGMQQRAAIARAFVTDPGVLLMDEPFAALDAQNRLILQAELARIWEESRKTVVYITHSIDEALTLGQRVVIMTAQPGRIKEVIEVPFEHPRDVAALSASARFAEMKLAVWKVLEEEVMRSRAEEAA
jgi:NitT/TauT family transport system ATP-binding protein